MEPEVVKHPSLSVAPLSDARCVLCGESLDDCICTFETRPPSIFPSSGFDLGSDELEE